MQKVDSGVRPPTRPRWLWRLALIVPAALCGAGAVRPDFDGLLNDELAYNLRFQVGHGCVVLGPMPDPTALKEWRNQVARIRQSPGERGCCLYIPGVAIEQWFLDFKCHDARKQGILLKSTWPGADHVIASLWLLSAALCLLGLPLLRALLTTWRRSRRCRQNHCIACGYSLTGLALPRCPECGLEFAVRASLSNATTIMPASSSCH